MASSASTVEPNNPLQVTPEDAKNDILVKVMNRADKKNNAIWLRTNPEQVRGDPILPRKIENGTTMRLASGYGVKDGCVFVFNPDDRDNETTQGWVKMVHLELVNPRIVDRTQEFWTKVLTDPDFSSQHDKLVTLAQHYNNILTNASMSMDDRSNYDNFKEYVKRLFIEAAPRGAEVMRPAQGGSRRRKSKISRRRRRRHNSKRNRKNTHTHKRKRRTHRRH
jgi:hypothetical protein